MAAARGGPLKAIDPLHLDLKRRQLSAQLLNWLRQIHLEDHDLFALTAIKDSTVLPIAGLLIWNFDHCLIPKEKPPILLIVGNF